LGRKRFFQYLSFFIFFLSFFFLFKEKFLFFKHAPTFSSFIPSDLLIEDSWYGVYFQDNFVGFSHFFMKIQEVKEGGGYFLENKTRLNLPILGYTQTISSSLRIILFSICDTYRVSCTIRVTDSE